MKLISLLFLMTIIGLAIFLLTNPLPFFDKSKTICFKYLDKISLVF